MPTPRPRALTLALALAVTAVSVATPAAGQSTPRPPGRPAVSETVGLNLLALPFGIASGEYERAVGGGFAVGVGGLASFVRGALDDGAGGGTPTAVPPVDYEVDRLATGQLKLKYYPARRGLRGFALGVTAGAIYNSGWRRPAVSVGAGGVPVAAPAAAPAAAPVERRSLTLPTLGAVADYNLMVGRDRRFLVGVGVGARRAFGGGLRGLDAVLPDARLQFGLGL